MKKIVKFLCFVCVGVMSPVVVNAESADSYMQLGVGTQDFSYKEFDDQDALFNREDGYMPGLVMEFGKNQQDVSGIFRFELFDGLVVYDGQTQSGIPLKAKTDERIMTIEALLHIKVKSLAQNSVALNVGLGHRKWRRDIQATNITNSLLEIYSWKYFTMGAEVVAWHRGKWSAGLDMRWLRPIKPTMSVDIAGYDEVTLDLKSSNGVRINFPFKLISNVGQKWTVTPYWESWKLGRSAGKNLTRNGVSTGLIVHEPYSETKIVGMTVSVHL